MKVLLAHALYDYEGELEGYEDKTLAFTRDALLCVTLAKNSGWWKGFLLADPSREVGWFPSNYVTTIQQDPVVFSDEVVSRLTR